MHILSAPNSYLNKFSLNIKKYTNICTYDWNIFGDKKAVQVQVGRFPWIPYRK